MSGKQRKTHTQFRFMVKNVFVEMYGIVAEVVESGLSANTRKVAQHPSIFSTRNTFEHTTPSSPQTTSSLVVGILHGVPFPQQVYSIIGLVLHPTVETLHPKNPLSQVSRQQLSEQFAFCCRIEITVRISAIHLQSFDSLLHI